MIIDQVIEPSLISGHPHFSRIKYYHNLVHELISKNLSSPLSIFICISSVLCIYSHCIVMMSIYFRFNFIIYDVILYHVI